jgi:GntR family transcriptional repressor for pyruvate dehydrogenase complex
MSFPDPVRLRLADHVVEHLVAAIVRGEHPPHSRLPNEDRLSKLYRVSRLTVREAMKTLQHKGVVRVEQGRGTFVNPVSRWSPLDPVLLAARVGTQEGASAVATLLTEARQLVEIGVARLAASRRSKDDLAELERHLAAMRAVSAAGEVESFTQADIDFHAVLIAAAGNPFVSALFEPIAALMFEVRLATSRSRPSRDQAIGAHAQVLEAVAASSPDAAEQAMRQHMHETAVRVDEIIKAEGLSISVLPQ